MNNNRTQPLVSVLMSAFNGGDYLTHSIESILKQTYKTFEFIIVDDGTTDGSVEAAKNIFSDSRIHWHWQRNSGKSVALNHALEKMRGEYYIIQDSDDVSHPRRIELLLNAMEDNPDVAAAFTGHELIMAGRHMAPVLLV